MVSFDLKKLFGVPTAEQRLAGLDLRPDLARAALKMVSDERSDREIVALEALLTDTESVITVVEGDRARRLGFLALTTERVVHRWHGAAPGAADEIGLADVSDVSDRARGMTGRVVVSCAQGQIEMTKILGVQAAQFAQDLRAQLADPARLPERDPVQELLELRERRTAGTITESDFQAAKVRLLDEL
ncbi:hypothetical protein [Nakamurella sp. PAMC28650]|jgi:hypothetical protein|uniref:hypothetical protein n=1 Tax=Nakamurella sp. PAMC28650 TaxID=2762325 RepID=UPI00164D2D59|nr:hypothetical protein [Nakamurella sp. PAMC28650]QNK82387.1 hypothetical protein H7F38_06550 [Nakamurella sp. PAMC28650]